jgi:hypothetical protein
MRIYRELHSDGKPAGHFALEVRRIEDDGEYCLGYCDKALYDPGGPAHLWRANRVLCTGKDIGAPNWTLLTEFCAPVRIVRSDASRVVSPRLLCGPEAPRSKAVLDEAAFAEDSIGDADTLTATALLVACLRMPRAFIRQDDSEQLAEEDTRSRERARAERDKPRVHGRHGY